MSARLVATVIPPQLLVLSHRVGAAGLCSDAADDVCFPAEPGESAAAMTRAEYEAYARRVCSGCPVLTECLELALGLEARPGVRAFGIWGGTAPWERDAERRRCQRRGPAAKPRRQLVGAGVGS